MTPVTLSIIKVGGSLLGWPDFRLRLKKFLREEFADTRGERPLLIAGGGPVVDMVRALDRIHNLNDELAHDLAIRAMTFSAQMLSAIVPGLSPIDTLDFVESVLEMGVIPVLAPFHVLALIENLGFDPLPKSWDITSDSIAARIATYVRASRLILLKSASICPDATRHDAVRAGLVDPFFPEAARSLQRVEYMNFRDPTAKLQTLAP